MEGREKADNNFSKGWYFLNNDATLVSDNNCIYGNENVKK